MASETLIEVQNLSVEFKTDEGLIKAVKNISFKIPKGKTVGLVGESGSGKSVSSLAIMKLIPNPPGRLQEDTNERKGQPSKQTGRPSSPW